MTPIDALKEEIDRLNTKIEYLSRQSIAKELTEGGEHHLKDLKWRRKKWEKLGKKFPSSIMEVVSNTKDIVSNPGEAISNISREFKEMRKEF